MNRSADSCESFGARLKKVIKHLTCRRRCRSDADGAPMQHEHKRTVGEDKKVWTQAFTKGYIGTAFTRVCVSTANLYTKESAPYQQREDARMLAHWPGWQAPGGAKSGTRPESACPYGCRNGARGGGGTMTVRGVGGGSVVLWVGQLYELRFCCGLL